MLPTLLFGFLSGIWISSLFHLSFSFFLAIVLLTVAFFVYKYFAPEESRFILVFSAVFLLSFLLGAGRIATSNLYTHSQLESFSGKRISAEGIVVDEPDERETNTKLTVRLSSVTLATTTFPVSEKILLTVPIYPKFSYGDKVKVDVTLNPPKQIESDDGRAFDYAGYLKVRGIWYVGNYARLTVESSGHGSVIKSSLFKIKHAFTASLSRALPEPESSFAAGLLIGTKQSLGKNLLSEFQRAGVSHVVVLSGYNIAIVAASVMSLLSFLPKKLSFGFGAVSIILFTLLSGGGASAWRAAIMVLVVLFAKQTNRESSTARAFGIAIYLMLLWNPMFLLFDPSFQLSVLATLGLIFISPILSPYFFWIKNATLKEIISTTVATQIIVLPYLIYTTGIVSLVSLPVNILILGTVPITMLFGFVTGLVGLFSLYLSFLPAFFAYILLWYQLAVVHIGASLPFGAVTLSAFSPIILVLVYLLIFAGLYFLKKKKL